ncbi:COG1361 S-layer family protein [Halovenus sp. HT40]|uniref:COG1361 S-layer family protein n=1 Tax=Halovenus sp. HT40 TaxID=3126691 RepID=UPI00300F4749
MSGVSPAARDARGPSGRHGGSRSGTERRQAVRAVVLAGLLVCSVVAPFIGTITPVAAQNTGGPVEGSVDLDVETQDGDLQRGEEQTLNLAVSNDGTVLTNGTHPTEVRDRATRAESTELNITDSPAEIDVRSGEQSPGDIDSGETVVSGFDVYVDEDADPGEYDLGVRAEYNNVTVTEYEQNSDGDVIAVDESRENVTEQFTVTVEVEPEPAFEINAADADVQVDESGDFTVELTNTGGEDAEDVVVTAESTDQDITFGSGGGASDRAVGQWAAGETNELTYQVNAAEDTVTEPYPIDLTVDFTDPDGNDGTDNLRTSIQPQPRQQFVVEGTDHSVPVGDNGIVEIDVRNAGPQDIENASVTVASGDPVITFPESDGEATSTTTFVGDWAAETTERLAVRVAVGSDAVRRNYTLDLTVDGRDESDSELNERTRQFGFEPEPRQVYTVENVSHDLVVGDNSPVSVQLRNLGPQNVSDARVTLTSSDSALTFADGTTTTEIFVGDWTANESRMISTRLIASEDAVTSSYSIEAAIDAQDGNGTALATRTQEFGVEPLPRQRYTIEETTHDVAVDDDGVLRVELRNDGPLNLSDASVEVTGNDAAITFGAGGSGEAVEVQDTAFETGETGQPSSEAFVGDWAVGETKTVAYQLGASEDALARNYTLEATVTARDADDEAVTARTREFGFEPDSEQTFEIDGTESTLRVGEDGTINGTLTNTGSEAVEGTAVLLNSDAETVLPRETQYAVGELAPGETADFEFRIGISEEAEAGPRIFEFESRYRDDGGEKRVDNSQDVFVEVAPERDAFVVESVDETLEPGESRTVEIELTNNLDYTVENIRAKIFPESPLSSSNDESFVASLEPGETGTFVFDLSAGGDAVPKGYPVSLDVRYDDDRGEPQLAGTYDVAVAVEESSGGGISLWVWLLGPMLLLGGVGLYFRETVSTAGTQLSAKLRGS